MFRCNILDICKALKVADGVIVIAAWTILSIAMARTHALKAVTVVASLIALLPLLFLSIWTAGARVPLLIFCIGFTALVVTAGWALWGQVASLFGLVSMDDRPTATQEVFRNAMYFLVASAFMFAIGFPVGQVSYVLEGWHLPGNELAQNIIWTTRLDFRLPLAWVSLLLVVSFLAAYMLTPSRQSTGRRDALVLAMMFCLSAPWINQIAIAVVTSVPVWLVQFGILVLLFELLRTRDLRQNEQRFAVGDGSSPSESAGAEQQVANDRGADSGAGSASSGTVGIQEGVLLRNLGSPGGSARQRQRCGAGGRYPRNIPGWLPLSCRIVGQLGGQLSTGWGLLVVVLFAFLEFVRWVVSGFVFGYLYSALPGRIGPMKALTFSGIWILSCLGPLVVARALGQDLFHETIYRSAQFALFLIVLTIIVDLRKVLSDGGTWRDLQAAYDVRDYREIIAAVVPAALLIVTLAQQIVSGSGLSVADSLLNAIPSVFK